MDSLSNAAVKLNELMRDFTRQIVSEMIDKGWQAPPGWTDEDTDKLGR